MLMLVRQGLAPPSPKRRVKSRRVTPGALRVIHLDHAFLSPAMLVKTSISVLWMIKNTDESPVEND